MMSRTRSITFSAVAAMLIVAAGTLPTSVAGARTNREGRRLSPEVLQLVRDQQIPLLSWAVVRNGNLSTGSLRSGRRAETGPRRSSTQLPSRSRCSRRPCCI